MYTSPPAPIRNPMTGGVPWPSTRIPTRSPFEPTSKRRKGFPSETQVKRGHRVVGDGKDLVEKLGRNDPCPCGSTRRFQELLHEIEEIRGFRSGRLLLGRPQGTPDNSLQPALDPAAPLAATNTPSASSAAELKR